MTGDTRIRAAMAVLLIGFLLPFASLPWASFGYWEKAEPLVAAFHGTSALACLVVLYLIRREGRAGIDRLCHPFGLVPLALGLWSAATAPLTDDPWRSLLGAPQSGMGAIWFVNFAIWWALARLLPQDDDLWRRITKVALFITLAVAAIKGWDWLRLHHQQSHWLIFVPSYYGWLALPLPIIAAKAKRGRAMAVACAALATSLNASLIVSFTLGQIAAWRVRTTHAPMNRRWLWIITGIIMGAAFLPWALLRWLPSLTAIESLRDRHLVQEMITQAILADPWRLLVGHGWGNSQDAFQIWLNSSGERLWSPTWIFLHSDYFHSHSWFLESLHAVGLPGVILTLAGFCLLPWRCRTELRPQAVALALATVLGLGLWFQLSFIVPPMAVAMARLADDRLPPRLPPRPGYRLACLGLVLIAVTQCWACLQTFQEGRALDKARAELLIWPPTISEQALAPISDLAFAEWTRDEIPRLADMNRRSPSPKLADSVRCLLDEVERRRQMNHSLQPLLSGLAMMTAIHVTEEWPFATAEGQDNLWRTWLDQLLAIAPYRDDQAIPYLTWRLGRQDVQGTADYADQILSRTPESPVGLYYRGLTRLLRAATPDQKAKGFADLRAALRLGIDRFLPIEPPLRAMIEQS